MTTGSEHKAGELNRRGRPKSRISGELAAVIAACTTAVGSFGVVISGIWMIHLTVQ